MPAWWDSIASVTAFTWWARWLGVALTFVGLLTTAASLSSSRRLDTLKTLRDDALQARVAAAEEHQKPRRLTPAQRDLLLKALKAGLKGKVRTISLLRDTEAAVFLDDIAKVLEESGWTVIREEPTPQGLPLGVGMFVNPQAEPPFAASLQKALESIGIEAPAITVSAM